MFSESQERDDHGMWTAGGANEKSKDAEKATQRAESKTNSAHDAEKASKNPNADRGSFGKSGAAHTLEQYHEAASKAHQEAAQAHNDAAKAQLSVAQNNKGAAGTAAYQKVDYHHSIAASHVRKMEAHQAAADTFGRK
jgi:hypothetical protein